MPSRRKGFSTVECLVALTVFSLGGLGAAGTVALGLRASARGTHAAQAARLAGQVVETLHSQLRSGGRRCGAIRAGSQFGPSGEVARWTLSPGTGGVDLSLIFSYATPTGQHTDSLRGFLRCQ